MKEGQSAPNPIHIRICILDGFLLYPNPNPNPKPTPSTSTTTTTSSSLPNPSSTIPTSLPSLLDIKLFLRSTYALTSTRRSRRAGYVTTTTTSSSDNLSFWRDPPGYIDEVVWPAYVRSHAWMFEYGDADYGDVRSELCLRGEKQEDEKEGEEDAAEDEGRCKRDGRVSVGPGFGERGIQEILEWAVGVLGERVRWEVETVMGVRKREDA
jgi:hypothetical protein